ncbi:MAG: hypothetical protein UT33_C0010G0071 [Candidatus Peregrinibacteria bacterium GW2011_GWC2_39_14]|nr:MAG: hypothetical protein US92_C0006G0071 [Candidatus Peregrinibacteria bacterium GW2011_GWA2_38_36]KKR05928.1 MAG: hypothetical protein UT33_C0010G0071 [Candidatus Peregrinibacteria bacterium GW2011_GWC2_39_14]
MDIFLKKLGIVKPFIVKYWPYLVLVPFLVYFSFYYPWYFQLVFLVFSAAIIGLYFKLHKSDVLDIPIWPLFAVSLAVLIFSRVYPFFLSDWPLGYDTGIYKFHFEKAFSIFPSFNTGLYPGVFLITDLLYAVGFKSVSILGGWYAFFDLLIPVALFFYCRREFGIKVAAISVFLFAVSLAQAQAYSFILYKNIIALSVMLFAFLLMERRSYFAILPAVYLVFLQPPDFLIFALTVAVYFVLNVKDKAKRNYILICMPIVAVLGAIMFIVSPNIMKEGLNTLVNFKEMGESAMKEGMFMDPAKYLGFSILYVPFAMFGFAYLINGRKFNLAFSYFFVVFLFIAFKLIFYKRFLIEFDLGVIMLASLGAYLIFRKFYLSISGKFTLFMIVFALIAATLYGTLMYKPFISKAELDDIQALSKTEKTSVVVATSSLHAPWLLGFSERPTIAPGMFDMNRWNFGDWQRFWRGSMADHLILWQDYKDIQGPLYLFYGLREPWPDFKNFPIYKRISNFVWKYVPGEVVNQETSDKSVKK